METRIFVATGDARTVLRMMPTGLAYTSISCPPNWRQRDDGVAEQLGQEETVEEYLENLCCVYDEVWRVLNNDGTTWVNLGDTYLPNKSLALVPFQFAVAMQKRGWILLNAVIWQQSSCIPNPVKDRSNLSSQYLFFFSKQHSYYFDPKIEPIKESSRGRSVSSYCLDTHYAVCPEELIETPILASCPKYGYVLDPFLGSGTTAIVCERLERSCLGIELNPEFVKIAKDRIKNAWRYEGQRDRVSRPHQARLDGDIPPHIHIDCSQDDWIEE